MWLVDLLRGLPNELIVFLVSATPVIEVRGAVPIALLLFKLPVVTTLILCVLGSILPVFPILWFLKIAVGKLRKIEFFDKFFEWLFARTRSKSKIIEDFELVGLTLFIAIPFPGTGVWTGTIAAYLLGLPWIPTFICATIGTTIASLILWAASAGIINFFL
ncbi:MAG: small multi-drug export protein [Candidatus Margulisbacteria bacterium]|nr:small multi-drug export protein [Candidatus Margulisiibacteriota bacterium]